MSREDYERWMKVVKEVLSHPLDEPHFSQVPHPLGEIRRLRAGRLSQDDALVTLSMCILGPDYSTLEVCRQDFRAAMDFGLPSSAHVWGRPTGWCLKATGLSPARGCSDPVTTWCMRTTSRTTKSSC